MLILVCKKENNEKSHLIEKDGGKVVIVVGTNSKSDGETAAKKQNSGRKVKKSTGRNRYAHMHHVTNQEWLGRSGLKAETECFILVTKYPRLITKVYQANILQIWTNTKSRYCDTYDYRIDHIVT